MIFFTFNFSVQNSVIFYGFKIIHIADKYHMTTSTSSHCSNIIVQVSYTVTDENLICTIIKSKYIYSSDMDKHCYRNYFVKTKYIPYFCFAFCSKIIFIVMEKRLLIRFLQFLFSVLDKLILLLTCKLTGRLGSKKGI